MYILVSSKNKLEEVGKRMIIEEGFCVLNI
jgi:hypothetical protein